MFRIVALAVAVVLPTAALPEPARSGTTPPRLVHVVTTSPGAGTHAVAGTLMAVRRALISTRMAAAVDAVEVEEGAKVREGALLVRLSDEDVRAQLAAAQTARDIAVTQERRVETLAAQGSATAVELDQVHAQRAQAEAAVTAARTSLRYTEIRAPFTGTVQARRVNAGDLVGPGQPVVEMEGAELEVVVSLSEEEARGIAIGQTLRFEAAGRPGRAKITALAPGGDPLSHRRTLRARLRESDGALRSGTFARVLLPATAGSPTAAGVFVPTTALVERGDLTGVFVIADGRARLRWLAIGEQVGDHVAIRAGLARGERVVDAPGALRDGDEVEVEP